MHQKVLIFYDYFSLLAMSVPILLLAKQLLKVVVQF